MSKINSIYISCVISSPNPMIDHLLEFFLSSPVCFVYPWPFPLSPAATSADLPLITCSRPANVYYNYATYASVDFVQLPQLLELSQQKKWSNIWSSEKCICTCIFIPIFLCSAVGLLGLYRLRPGSSLCRRSSRILTTSELRRSRSSTASWYFLSSCGR